MYRYPANVCRVATLPGFKGGIAIIIYKWDLDRMSKVTGDMRYVISMGSDNQSTPAGRELVQLCTKIETIITYWTPWQTPPVQYYTFS